MKLSQKAAMFGLDARIALAIFGALSVIAGASLYSAIQESTATALLTELTELQKAYEQYYIDTGTHINRTDAVTYEIKELIEDINSIPNWQGPYIGYNKLNDTSKIVLDHPKYNNILIRRMSLQTWDGGYIACGAEKDCALFVNINGIPKENYALLIDNKVDGGDGANDGKFRWWYLDDSNQYRYEYQIMNVTYEAS